MEASSGTVDIVNSVQEVNRQWRPTLSTILGTHQLTHSYGYGLMNPVSSNGHRCCQSRHVDGQTQSIMPHVFITTGLKTLILSN